MFVSCSQIKTDTVKKQDVMTLSDSDDVQTISSGSDDNKEREKLTQGKERAASWRWNFKNTICLNAECTDHPKPHFTLLL